MSDLPKSHLTEEEKYYLFEFNAQTATQMGNFLVRYCFEQQINLCFRIYAFGKIIYHFSSDYCTPDHDRWLQRKINTVLHFHQSTKNIGLKLNQDASLFLHKYGLNPANYTVVSGGVPLFVQSVGLIGAIAVSSQQPMVHIWLRG